MNLVSEDHFVLYVFHPKFFRSTLKRNLTFFRSSINTRLANQSYNVKLFTPFIIPFAYIIPFLHKLNIRLSSFVIKRILNKLGITKYVLWFYDPESGSYMNFLDPKLSCYDCVDDFKAMPGYKDPVIQRRLINNENKLVRNCDIVFTTSSKLYNQKKLLNANTFLVENVGDFEHFSKANTQNFSKPVDFPEISGKVVGFVGALDSYKVDFELIEHLATSRPDYSFLFIGSKMSSKNNLTALPDNKNIYYLGQKAYDALPSYLCFFDACIIPYSINEYTLGVFPIKFFEFLATGKPVITTNLPALKSYQQFVGYSSSKSEFLQNLDDALFQDTEIIKSVRVSIASNNDWKSRKSKLLSHIFNMFEDV